MPSIWRRMFGRSADPVGMSAARPSAQFSVTVPPEMLQAMTGGGNIAPRISRDEALQVPAVLRARNLICSSLATLPLGVWGPGRRPIPAPGSGEPGAVTYLTNTPPDPELAQSVLMAMTYEDLFFESVSWWRVTDFGWHGFPVEARHVPLSCVHVAGVGTPATLDLPYPIGGQVYIDGVPVPDNEIIRFDSPNPPLLRHAARAIRTCLLLDKMAALFASKPRPLGVFTDQDGAERLTDDEIQDQLDQWEAARDQGVDAHIRGMQWTPAGWNPQQLQLADARQHAVLEIARATGLDAEELGVAITSRTYANRDQRNQDKINFTLGGYASAVQERLSMRDVLPRGYETRVNFGGFLRADEKTRMDTYKVGLEVGAYTEDEVREQEGKPPLTPAQKAARKPAPMPPQTAPPEPEQAPEPQQQEREETPVAQHFDAGGSTRLQFETEDFRVDAQRRTIVGLLLPWGKVANNGAGKWRFTPGSVNWADVTRVKLNRHHDNHDLIGVATRLQSGSRGLTGTFKLGRGPEADRALQDAEDGILDGFSVEVDFDDVDAWEPDPADSSVNLVRRSNLRGAALTGTPAFDDARLTSVNASRDQQRGTPMTATPVANGQQGAAFDFDGHMEKLADKITESHTKLTEDLAASLGESFSAGVKAALENITAPQDGPQPVRASRFTVTREAPVYSLDGAGHSIVRDAWYAGREHDHEALERLRKFRVQSEDVAKLARQAARFANGQPQSFATVTTGTASQVIPPGYRPDLFVPMLGQGRPLVNALSQGTIENATPFVVPVFSSFSGASADHVEGTNPTDGSLAFGTKTVTPGAISGKLILTREIVDSSNPAIDQIAFNAMRESYARQTEGKVYTLLNGANGAGGTITGDTVPSGAQASTIAAGTDQQALVKHIRERLAKYPFLRFASAAVGLMGAGATGRLATAVDTTQRPLLPSVSAENSAGLGNAATQGWSVDGLPFRPAWAMTGVAAGDSQIFILNPADAWVWESPLLTFRYEEKSGPALIELALFGYFATHLLRPVGLSGIRIT